MDPVNGDRPWNTDTMITATSITLETTTQAQDSVYVWLPLIVVIIFALIIALLIVVGRQSADNRAPCCERQRRSSHDIQSNEVLQANDNSGFTVGEDRVPATPPPTYSSIARQISYASYISQASSQLEIPPGYEDAVNIPDRTAGNDTIVVMPNGTKPTQKPVTTRFRIFSRSLSGGDAQPRRGISTQTSTTSEASSRQGTLIGTRRASETVFEHPELEEYEAGSHRVEQVTGAQASGSQLTPQPSSLPLGNPLSTAAVDEDSDDDVIVMHDL